MPDFSWEILYGIGALALAFALVWGLMRNARRNRSNDAVTEAATREEYDHPDRYRSEQRTFEERLQP
jgi:hypothetical protein